MRHRPLFRTPRPSRRFASRGGGARRGSALIEFVFCIPLLALIILGTFFFGHVMRNQQRLRVADRYHAWRLVQNADAQADMSSHSYTRYGEPDDTAEQDAFQDEYSQANIVKVDAERINTLFFDKRATNVSMDRHGGPRETLDDLQEATREKSEDAGDLVDEAIPHWPHGSRSRIDATFPRELASWGRIENAFLEGETPTHTSRSNVKMRQSLRDGVQWRRWQNSYRDPIRDAFLMELESAINTVDDSELQKCLRDLYMKQW